MISTRLRTIELQFDSANSNVRDDVDIRHGLSAVAGDGEHLWLACDEGCRLERLTARPNGRVFDAHRVFPLADLLDLPAASTEESDLEGLDVDDGWLWLVGSHSVKRKKPKNDDAGEALARKLATTSRDGNRHLLARIPLADGLPRSQHDDRRAAALPGSDVSSGLLEAIAASEDPHLAPFLALPGKDNGFDIEGLAVRGDRIFLGLRGPVLREWCCILKLSVEADGEHLRLRPDDGRRYRKHFVRLNGLGARDLAALDDDLLILAGPTMAHDGPHEIWRWRNAFSRKPAKRVDVDRVLRLPMRAGVDRPEGMMVIDGGAKPAVLLVYDSPAPERLEGSSVTADVFTLEG